MNIILRILNITKEEFFNTTTSVLMNNFSLKMSNLIIVGEFKLNFLTFNKRSLESRILQNKKVFSDF